MYSPAMTFFKRDKNMNNHFENKDSEQNIAQGDNPIGKQVNNYFRQPLKPHFLIIAALLAAGVMSTALFVYDQYTPSVVVTGGNGSEQNIVQGNNAIDKQVNNYGVPLEQYDRIKKELDVGDAALTSFFRILKQGKVPREDWGSRLPEIAFRYKELLLRFEAVSSDNPEVQALKREAKQAITNDEYDRADELLDQIDERHDKALEQLYTLQAETAERLEQEQLAKAVNLVSRAWLQRLQYNYEQSVQYWQEAAAALPEGHEAERAEYLGGAGNDLYRIACYAEALSLYEQSLSIRRKIGDRNGEAKSLNNISQIYHAQGEYGKAWDYLEQSLPIYREVGDTEGQGTTLNNIAKLAGAKGNYTKALKYFEQSLPLYREIHYREGEGWSLNNIGEIHRQQGDYPAALEYYKQALTLAREIKEKALESTVLNNIGTVYYAQENYDAALEQDEQDLAIFRQIGDRRNEGRCLNNIAAIYKAKGDYPAALKQHKKALAIAEEIGAKAEEAVISGNIGWLYANQGEPAKAEPYLSRTVELEEQLEHPALEDARKLLEAVRAKLQEQQ